MAPSWDRADARDCDRIFAMELEHLNLRAVVRNLISTNWLPRAQFIFRGFIDGLEECLSSSTIPKSFAIENHSMHSSSRTRSRGKAKGPKLFGKAQSDFLSSSKAIRPPIGTSRHQTWQLHHLLLSRPLGPQTRPREVLPSREPQQGTCTAAPDQYSR